jgi:hypothetical protein
MGLLNNLATFLDVIASEAWQSHKSNNKKEDRIIFSRKNGIDFFLTRLPRFARNDTFVFNIINRNVALLLIINNSP